MPETADPWFEPIPAWIEDIADRVLEANSRGRVLMRETVDQLMLTLYCLEIDEYPAPEIVILGPRCIKLSWQGDRKKMELYARPRGCDLLTSHPHPSRRAIGEGALGNAQRLTFEWFRPTPASTQIRRNDP